MQIANWSRQSGQRTGISGFARQPPISIGDNGAAFVGGNRFNGFLIALRRESPHGNKFPCYMVTSPVNRAKTSTITGGNRFGLPTQPCGSRAGFFVARLFTAVRGRSRAWGTAPGRRRVPPRAPGGGLHTTPRQFHELGRHVARVFMPGTKRPPGTPRPPGVVARPPHGTASPGVVARTPRGVMTKRPPAPDQQPRTRAQRPTAPGGGLHTTPRQFHELGRHVARVFMPGTKRPPGTKRC